MKPHRKTDETMNLRPRTAILSKITQLESTPNKKSAIWCYIAALKWVLGDSEEL